MEEQEKQLNLALKRLDDWYITKVEEKYTKKAAKEFIDKINNKMKDWEKFECVTDVDGFRECFKRDKMLRQSGGLWSGSYASFEEHRNLAENTTVFPESVKQEYIYPYIEHLQVKENFIKIIGESIALAPLEDKYIDGEFSNHFHGLEGYLQYEKKAMQLFPCCLYRMLQITGQLKVFESCEALNQLNIQVMPDFWSIIYADIPPYKKAEKQKGATIK